VGTGKNGIAQVHIKRGGGKALRGPGTRKASNLESKPPWPFLRGQTKGGVQTGT